MTAIQTIITAFIEDVNREDGFFLQTCGNITHFLFSIIKWTCVPFTFYLLIEFLNT